MLDIFYFKYCFLELKKMYFCETKLDFFKKYKFGINVGHRCLKLEASNTKKKNKNPNSQIIFWALETGYRKIILFIIKNLVVNCIHKNMVFFFF